MIAFHNDPALKDLYLKQVEAHALADEIMQGHYWENGKGCAVGCVIHGNQHSKYETLLGIPETIAFLEDRIFEGLSSGEAKALPIQFLNAIAVGANLSLVTAIFILWLLVDPDNGVIRFAKTEQTRKVIEGVAKLHRKWLAGKPPTTTQWIKARSAAAYASSSSAAAAYAADAAYAAAAAYASSSSSAAAAYAAAAAAYAASSSAAAAYADADAAYAASSSAAYAAAYAAAAAAAARTKAYQSMRDQLLKLLAEAPVAADAQ